MKAVEILKEEFKKAGLAELEAVAEEAIKVVFEKIIPRLAVEADESYVKMAAGVASLASSALESAALKAADKIDGQIVAP